MQIIFFGSDQYSAIVLDKLSRSGNGITAVITTRTSTPNPVEILASTHNIKLLYYPINIDDLSKLVKHGAIGVSASFGRILSADLLRLFPHGIYNLHPSLLPQYRNVAPVPYALAMGDEVTGITIFRMDEQVDHGQIVAQIEEKISSTDTTPILLTRLFSIGSELLTNWLSGTRSSPLVRVTDPLIFTRKLSRESGLIEWAVFQKFLQGRTLKISDTANPLLTLRLNNHPERNSAVSAISDLSRALEGYEKLWTTTPKGQTVKIHSLSPILLHLPGKPSPINYADFQKYYL